ncbi:MAG TPA: 5-formyltetrahydrofolate cyclo-ligase [Candidatus Latescibacteria bacterium]|nr:5-formyltetrahydrofolate cyclo-ligase [Candidatus Latescibacterota bacterium]
MVQKNEIRRRVLARRSTLLEEDALRKSRIITERLMGLQEYKRAAVIHCYVSKDKEVDTRCLIQRALSSGKRVIVPVTDLEKRRLFHSEIKALEELEKGTFGILEPKQECLRFVEPDIIDLVIVPGVAFDPYGNRIGFGGGFYDRFLAGLKVPKIGLAYQFQILDRIETTHLDVRVDSVMTEERIYRRSN